MSRRGKGEGSIYRRDDGRWVAQLLLPDGKYKYLYGKTRAIAAARLAEAQQRVKQGQLLPDERLTVQEYLEEWLSTVQRRHNLKDKTARRYRESLRLHVIPALGRVPLNQLSVPHLRALYDEKQQKMPLSTLHTIHAVLHNALQDALVDERVYRNVASIARPAPLKMQQQKHRYLTPEEADTLLEKAHELQDRWEALYWLALNTGMRENELLSLHWPDVDFTRQRLHIHQAKTDAGVREPGLIRPVLEKLHEQRARLAEERLRAGPRWKNQEDFDQGLVFPNTVGKQQDPSRFLTDHFYKLLEAAGLPCVTFHSLRHTAISWLLSLGIPVVDVAAYVGHADATTTLKVYAHSFPGSQQALLEAMERSRSGGK